jgi:hypothetical protein
VSTFDLVVISKHILNLDPFVHPWQYVAADVNYSNTVTTFDIAQIRKLILGLTDTFPNNVSWRFLAADCALPNVPLPLPCMNSVTFSLPLAGPLPEFDFYGIKLGDVNGSAVTQTVAAPAEPRGTDQLMFPDMVLDAGALTDVPVRLNAAGDRLGLQVALRFDADVLEVADVQAPGLPDFDASCWAVVGNEIRLSWATATPQALLPDAPVFVLRVRARTEARLRDAFELVSDRLPAESYAADGSLNKLQLAFNHRIHAVNPVPQPNPSAAGTQWPLRLKEAGSVQFQLVDSQGRLCHEQNQGLEAGAHWLVLPDRSDLYPGVYTWRIRTAEGVWTGQWVKI